MIPWNGGTKGVNVVFYKKVVQLSIQYTSRCVYYCNRNNGTKQKTGLELKPAPQAIDHRGDDLNPAPPVIQKELADAVLAHVTGSEITQTKGLAAIASMTESNNSLHN
jgi:hypothetical protein